MYNRQRHGGMGRDKENTGDHTDRLVRCSQKTESRQGRVTVVLCPQGSAYRRSSNDSESSAVYTEEVLGNA
eukprot:1013266-Rhodomonas_salina.3